MPHVFLSQFCDVAKRWQPSTKHSKWAFDLGGLNVLHKEKKEKGEKKKRKRCKQIWLQVNFDKEIKAPFCIVGLHTEMLI